MVVRMENGRTGGWGEWGENVGAMTGSIEVSMTLKHTAELV